MSTQNVNIARFARNVEWDFFLWFSNTYNVCSCFLFSTFLLLQLFPDGATSYTLVSSKPVAVSFYTSSSILSPFKNQLNFLYNFNNKYLTISSFCPDNDQKNWVEDTRFVLDFVNKSFTKQKVCCSVLLSPSCFEELVTKVILFNKGLKLKIMKTLMF